MLERVRAWWPGALAGLAAIAVGLAASELVARLVDGGSLVIAIGDFIIDNSPRAVSQWAIDTFGTNDKPVLIAGVTVVTLLVGTGLGALSLRSRLIGAAGLAALSIVGGLAAAHDQLISDADAAITAASAAAVAIGALLGLRWAASPNRAADDDADGAPASRAERRRFLYLAGGGLAGAAVLTPLVRRFIDTGPDVEAQRASVAEQIAGSRRAQATATATATPTQAATATAAAPNASPEAIATPTATAAPDPTATATSAPAAEATPEAAETATPEPELTPQPTPEPTPAPTPEPPPASVAGAGPETVPGISPLITPNDRFYRIDTELSVPRIDIEEWRLTIKGMVNRELELSFADLLERGTEEEAVTLACVSNSVGGNLVGNARWLGVPLPDLLREAGVPAEATQVVGRSVDGFTVGFPTETALDGRKSMVVIGMNGEPLPVKHGFPARLIVPGLYGYASATKWLKEIELTRLDSFESFWVRQGWAQRGPIKLQSRIDVPWNEEEVPAGNVRIAGVAWAGLKGISGVQVRPARRNGGGDGDWRDAILGEELSDSSWRQWVVDWPAAEGSFDLEVRAIDRNGRVQTADKQQPFPDGATGHHTIRVNIET